MINPTTLSNSGLMAYFTCPKKYDWAIRQGWQPITDTPALRFGKEFHKALETDTLNTELFDTDIAQKMVDLYTIYKQHLADTNTVFVDKERKLDIPMPYRPNHLIVAKVDGIVEIDGKRYLYELKTTSEEPYSRAQKLRHENQVWLYAYMAQLNSISIEGIIIDIVSTKNLPVPPRLLKSGKLSKDVSQNTTQELFVDFCEKNNYTPDQDEIDFYTLNFPLNYIPVYRETLDIPDFSIKENKDQLILPYRLLCDAIKDNAFWKNTNSCLIFKSKCAYYDLCFATTQAEIDYILQTSFKRSDYYAAACNTPEEN